VEIARSLGTPILIHQPSYSMLNRWVEPELLGTTDELGVGVIAFSPLAQGMLTDRYLDGIPADSRAAKDFYLKKDFINEDNMARVRALNEIAQQRGQALAQMALAWVLRDARVTSALIGASSVQQLETNVAALENLAFTDEELAEIDQHAVESGINIWATSSEA
jgi:L-glyceraldehyde 3-phosphate reductase